MRGCARDIRGPSCANMQVEEWAFRFDLSPATTLWPIRPGIHERLRDGSMRGADLARSSIAGCRRPCAVVGPICVNAH
jgi:hypothetical protein